eukprot:gene8377-biopygen22622
MARHESTNQKSRSALLNKTSFKNEMRIPIGKTATLLGTSLPGRRRKWAASVAVRLSFRPRSAGGGRAGTFPLEAPGHTGLVSIISYFTSAGQLAPLPGNRGQTRAALTTAVLFLPLECAPKPQRLGQPLQNR